MRFVHGEKSILHDRPLRELIEMLESIAASPEFVLHVVPVTGRDDAVVVQLRNETCNGAWDDELLGCITTKGALTLVQRHEAELLAARHVSRRGFVRPRYHIAWEGRGR